MVNGAKRDDVGVVDSALLAIRAGSEQKALLSGDGDWTNPGPPPVK